MAYRTIDELDPGIAAVVRLLREAGFDTTDSGDGVSKPQDWYESGEALPFPHVFVMMRASDFLLSADFALRSFGEAARMQSLLDGHEPGWRVEASYAPQDHSVVLMASKGADPSIRVADTQEASR